jgi:BON domain-containing protein
MNEPLFGPVSPPWPAAPFPPTGWLPSSMSFAARPLAAASPVPASTVSLTSGMPTVWPPATGVAAGSVAPAIGVMPVGATIPSFAGSEVAVGVPVPALLATIAVRRGQPLGPSNDQEIEDFIYDALEILPGSGEVDVRCEGGRVTFTGTVHYKRLKRDVGEIAWAIPGVNDVHNTVTIAARRRSRGVSQSEPQTAVGRKSA